MPNPAPSLAPSHDPADPAAYVVRRLAPTRRDEALATVVAAFAAEPVLRWVWPDDERYAACAPGFFGLLLDLRLAAGEVWAVAGSADGPVDAVAMWDPPGGLYTPPGDGVWAAPQSAYTAAERARWRAFDEAMAVPDDADPHWHLGVLATRPERQGQGLGRAVVAPMLAAADRTGAATFLETAGAANVAFYERLGFVAVDEASMPDGPRAYLLRRPPAAPNAGPAQEDAAREVTGAAS